MIEKGHVVNFDSYTGVALIKLSNNLLITLHMAAIYGKRTAPSIGDKLYVNINHGVASVARFVGEF